MVDHILLQTRQTPSRVLFNLTTSCLSFEFTIFIILAQRLRLTAVSVTILRQIPVRGSCRTLAWSESVPQSQPSSVDFLPPLAALLLLRFREQLLPATCINNHQHPAPRTLSRLSHSLPSLPQADTCILSLQWHSAHSCSQTSTQRVESSETSGSCLSFGKASMHPPSY